MITKLEKAMCSLLNCTWLKMEQQIVKINQSERSMRIINKFETKVNSKNNGYNKNFQLNDNGNYNGNYSYNDGYNTGVSHSASYPEHHKVALSIENEKPGTNVRTLQEDYMMKRESNQRNTIEKFELAYPFIRFAVCPICKGGNSFDKYSAYICLLKERLICKRAKCNANTGISTLPITFRNQLYQFLKESQVLFREKVKKYVALRKVYDERFVPSLMTMTQTGCLAFKYDGGLKVRTVDDTVNFQNGRDFSKRFIWKNHKAAVHTPFALKFLETFSAAAHTDTIYVAFGEFDCISLLKQGFYAISSPNGDSLAFIKTIPQYLASIKKRFKRIVFCFDNDSNYVSLVSKTSEIIAGPDWQDYEVRVLNPAFYRDCKDLNQVLVELPEINWSQELNLHTRALETVSCFNAMPVGEVPNLDVKAAQGLRTLFAPLDNATLGLQTGNILVAAGRGGTGKSTFVLNLLARFASRNVRSLYWSSEESLPQIASNLRRIFAGENTREKQTDDGLTYYEADAQSGDFTKLNNIFLSGISEAPLNTEAYRLLGTFVQENDIKVIAIDNLVGITGDSEDYYREQGRLIKFLKEFAVRYKVLVILVHHSRKRQNAKTQMHGDDIEGSSKIRDWASYVLLFHRDEETNQLIVRLDKNRSPLTGGKLIEMPLEFDLKSLRLVATDDIERSGKSLQTYDIFHYPNQQDFEGFDDDVSDNKDSSDNSSSSDNKNTTTHFSSNTDSDDTTNSDDIDDGDSGDSNGNNAKGNTGNSGSSGNTSGSDDFRLTAPNVIEIRPPDNLNYYHLKTPSEVESFVNRIAPKLVVAFDTETSGVERDRELLAASIAFRWMDKIEAACVTGAGLKYLADWIYSAPNTFTGFNIAFDLITLHNTFQRDYSAKIKFLDVQVLGGLLFPTVERGISYVSLDTYALKFLNLKKLSLSEIFERKNRQYQGLCADSFNSIPELVYYSAEDAYATLLLYEIFRDKYHDKSVEHLLTLLQTEHAALRALIKAEQQGFCFDRVKLDEFCQQLEEETARAESEMASDNVIKTICEKHNLISFNPQSSVHKKYLAEELNLPSISLDKVSRKDFDLPVLQKISRYLDNKSFLNSNLKRFYRFVSPNSKIHSSFLLNGATSGRIISKNPNIQNVVHNERYPIRSCFRASDGCLLVVADYSQIELRILALRAGARTLLEAFDAGSDIHRHMAAILFDKSFDDVSDAERKRAKSMTFGILYGMGVNKLATMLGVSTEQAKEIIDNYYKVFTEIYDYRNAVRAFVKKNGYSESMLGRRLPAIFDDQNNIANWVSLFNFTIQASAADCLKTALSLIDEYLSYSPDIKFIHTIHDEVVFEVPAEKADFYLAEIKELLEFYIVSVDAFGVVNENLRHQLKVDARICQNWAEK